MKRTTIVQDENIKNVDARTVFQAMKKTGAEKISIYFDVTSGNIRFDEIHGLPATPLAGSVESAIESTAWSAIRTAYPLLQANNVSGVVEFTPDDPTGAGFRVRVVTFIPTGAEDRQEASLFPEFPPGYLAQIDGADVSLTEQLPSLIAYRGEINRLMTAFKMDLIELDYDLDDEKRAIGGISYVREGARAGGLKGVLQAPADNRAARFASAYLERVLTLFVQKFFEENGGGLSGRGTELPGSGMMSIAPAANRELLVDLTHQHRIVTTMEIAHSFSWDLHGIEHSTHRLA